MDTRCTSSRCQRWLQYRKRRILLLPDDGNVNLNVLFPPSEPSLTTGLIIRIAFFELITRFSLPLCSHLPHPSPTTPISSVTVIADFGDASFSSFWYFRSHIGEAACLATANYPEILHKVVIVNPPAFFPIVWGWLKVSKKSLVRRKES